MERLTIRNSDGSVSQPTRLDWVAALERLAAYEDTGLEPEEIGELAVNMERARPYKAFFEDLADGQKLSEALSHIRHLAQADREGRCVVLPATTVFELTWDAGPGCDMICPASFDGEGLCDICEHGQKFVYERKCTQRLAEGIGKTVFLTREEAEAALKGEEE